MTFSISVAGRAALTGSLTLALVPWSALGSGFSLPEVSTAGIGTANAIVANPDEPGAFAYNAAAMGFHDRSSLALGGFVINPNFSVETASGNHDSRGAEWLAVPMIQAAVRVDERWRVGFGVNAPFGLETRWYEGVFPDLSGTLTVTVPTPIGPMPVELPKGAHPTQSKLDIVALVPTATYRVNDNLSLSAGIDYYINRRAQLNTQITKLEGEGDGWGWNLGAMLVHGPWSLGASYHSAASIGIEGIFAADLPTPSRRDARVTLDLPWRLQLGVRYEINDRLAVEADWTRSGWSEFDVLEIRDKATGTVLTTNSNKLTDSDAYRFGLTYDLLPGTQLRLGYTYDETGQGDEFFSARLADNDRQLYSVGLARELGGGWAVEAAYMYIDFDERKFRGTTPYTPGNLSQETNGTDAIDGDYKAYAHIIGLEVRKTF